MKIVIDDHHYVSTIDVASSTHLDPYLELRRQYWVDEMHWTTSEWDEFDDESAHFGFYDKDELVGCCRFVPVQFGTLPLVKVFPATQVVIDELGADKCGEFSRLIVKKNYRGGDSLRASIFIHKAVYQYTRRVTPIDYWFMEVEEWLLDQLLGLGYDAQPIGQWTCGYKGYNDHPDQVTLPVVLDIDSTANKIKNNKPDVYDWFVNT